MNPGAMDFPFPDHKSIAPGFIRGIFYPPPCNLPHSTGIFSLNIT